MIHNAHGKPSTRTFSILGMTITLSCPICILGDGGAQEAFVLEVDGRRGCIDLSDRHGAKRPNCFSNFGIVLDQIAAAFARPLVVTRHAGLVDYLREEFGLDGVEVVDHATPEQVRGRVVIGVLPAHLAAETLVHVEIPLDMSRAVRGAELDAAAMRAIASHPRIYAVSGV